MQDCCPKSMISSWSAIVPDWPFHGPAHNGKPTQVRRPSMRPCSPITQQSGACTRGRWIDPCRILVLVPYRTVNICMLSGYSLFVATRAPVDCLGSIPAPSPPISPHPLVFFFFWSFPSLVLFFLSTSCRPCPRQPVHDATVRRSPEAAKPAVPIVRPSHSPSVP